jgi:hypothetical protein
MEGQSENKLSPSGSRRDMLIGMVGGAAIGAFIGWLIDDVKWGVLVGFLLGGAIGSRALQGRHLMQYPPHIVRRLIFSAILFFAVLRGSFALLQEETGKNLSYLLAIAPSVPGIFFVYTIGSAIASLDELQRRIQIEAIAIGFGITTIITLSYGLLSFADVPQPSLMYVSFIMVLSWGVGKIWTMWKYR